MPQTPRVTAAEIMTHRVLAIDPQAPLLQAIRLMTQNRVSGLPVVDRTGMVVGVLTEGDLIRRAETGTETKPRSWLASFFAPARDAASFVRSHGTRVEEVMTPSVIGVAADAGLSQIAALMQLHNVKRLPVLRDGKLLGIVSRADLVRQVGLALEAAPGSAADDSIQTAILAALDRQSWSPRASLTVGVDAGVVQLDGCVFDIRIRDAVGVVAETAQGVTRVENRIVCIEPYSGMITYDPAADESQAATTV